MPQWLQAYGLLIGTVLGIAGTLFTTWLNNRASDARLYRQFEEERQRESIRVRRERLEELHVSLEQWAVTLSIFGHLGKRLAHKKLSYRGYIDQQLEVKNRADLPRMRTLIKIYAGQSGAAAYQMVIDAQASVMLALGPIEAAAKQDMDVALMASEQNRDALAVAIAGVDEALGRLIDLVAAAVLRP